MVCLIVFKSISRLFSLLMKCLAFDGVFFYGSVAASVSLVSAGFITSFQAQEKSTAALQKHRAKYFNTSFNRQFWQTK